MFLALSIRPDIAKTANVLSLFSENPGNKLWNAANACLRYMKGRNSENKIEKNCDKFDLKDFLGF